VTGDARLTITVAGASIVEQPVEHLVRVWKGL